MESYDAKIVQELHNNSTNDIEKNTSIVVNWVNQWIKNAENSRNGIFEIDGAEKSKIC